jgi:hypothetical protein
VRRWVQKKKKAEVKKEYKPRFMKPDGTVVIAGVERPVHGSGKLAHVLIGDTYILLSHLQGRK